MLCKFECLFNFMIICGFFLFFFSQVKNKANLDNLSFTEFCWKQSKGNILIENNFNLWGLGKMYSLLQPNKFQRAEVDSFVHFFSNPDFPISKSKIEHPFILHKSLAFFNVQQLTCIERKCLLCDKIKWLAEFRLWYYLFGTK